MATKRIGPIGLATARALAYNVKLINLSPVKRIDVKFDPFGGNVKSIRNFLFNVSTPKAKLSNHNCVLKVEVETNRCEPAVEVRYNDGSKTIFKTTHLGCIELMQLFNKHCRLRDVKDEARDKR